MDIEKLYNTHASRLTNWLIATGSSYPQACDLTQETFLKLWNVRNTLIDDEHALSGLVFTIAKNLRKNDFRDNQKIVLTGNIPEDSQISLPEPSLSDHTYIHHRIQSAIKSLPHLLREAYTLFQIAELSIAEIARETQATESLVKVRIHRAKMKLRETLADLKASK
ncbi:MAG: RNA polymerase sigma factor [Kiritimatiellae bacterium]|nr:RNA polymerase sigma factor [Kiritimatiellia bacterium]